MSEDEAWDKFFLTGNVLDYLVYSSIKNGDNYNLKGAKFYVGQLGRLDNNGKTNL